MHSLSLSPSPLSLSLSLSLSSSTLLKHTLFIETHSKQYLCYRLRMDECNWEDFTSMGHTSSTQLQTRYRMQPDWWKLNSQLIFKRFDWIRASWIFNI